MSLSTNQYIKPLTTVRNSKGNLEIGGCDLVSLADKYGTPLYVIDEKTLRNICHDYKKAFENYPVNNDDEIEADFLSFPAGTSKFDVWHWFDERCPNNLHDDLMY